MVEMLALVACLRTDAAVLVVGGRSTGCPKLVVDRHPRAPDGAPGSSSCAARCTTRRP
jgi:hypothetical protein